LTVVKEFADMKNISTIDNIYLEVFICRNTKPFWRIQELMWEDNMQCSSILRNN